MISGIYHVKYSRRITAWPLLPLAQKPYSRYISVAQLTNPITDVIYSLLGYYTGNWTAHDPSNCTHHRAKVNMSCIWLWQLMQKYHWYHRREIPKNAFQWIISIFYQVYWRIFTIAIFTRPVTSVIFLLCVTGIFLMLFLSIRLYPTHQHFS